MSPFFLSSAVPRRFTALSKRRARGREGFENRGGVFRLSRRGGELVLFFACLFFSRLTNRKCTRTPRRGTLFVFSLSLSVCVCA